MSKFDLSGRPYVRLSELRAGVLVELDEDFTCRRAGPAVVQDYGDGPFIFCDEGRHYLEGQCDEDGYCVGVYKHEED